MFWYVIYSGILINVIVLDIINISILVRIRGGFFILYNLVYNCLLIYCFMRF